MAEGGLPARRGRDDGLIGGAVVLVLVGTVLGLAYNFAGLRSRPAYGVAWIKEPRELEDLSSFLVTNTTPTPNPASDGVPEIPITGEPLQIQIDAVKSFFDADGAVFLDARESAAYEESHIAGATSLPYEEALPEDLEALDSGGRPIITYCDGGTCEVSMNLAWDLIHAGHPRVLVFLGGMPEWAERGYPVATGAEDAASAPTESSFSTDIDDPMGFFGAAADLPEIPELDRPLSMDLATVKQFYDAGAALLLDARERAEYDEGHIPGALHLSYELVREDPSLLVTLDPGDRPIVAYCGGGTCEVSMTLADALIEAGHRKVLVFVGGFPEWEAAGYPVARGGDDRGA